MGKFWKNKKRMHQILVGILVAVCLVGIAAAGNLTRTAPAFDAAQTESLRDGEDGDSGQESEKTADDGGETGRQQEGEQVSGENTTSDGEASGENGTSGLASISRGNDSKDQASEQNQETSHSKSQTSGQSQGTSGGQNQTSGQEQPQNGAGQSSQNPETGSAQDNQQTGEISCTISIRCDSVSGNGVLTANGHPELESWAQNPVILESAVIPVKEGGSVYDVLQAACRSAGIHLESRYTPAYGSYYVEGINHLYEWQAGPGSGWIYEVNGKSVNVGASSCILSEGDVIVWEYVHR